jgi:thioredoxin 1
MTKPVLERLASEFKDQVEFIPINADDSPDLVKQYRILGIPTVLAFQSGAEASRVTGAQSESHYRAIFEALARGEAVKASVPSFERMLRLGAGLLLVVVGISTGSWLVTGLGGLLAFLGVYDRCPVWKAITGTLRRVFPGSVLSKSITK